MASIDPGPDYIGHWPWREKTFASHAGNGTTIDRMNKEQPCPPSSAPWNLTPGELIEYTPDWDGERFADGRPKVPDPIIERMKNVSITQAWGVVRGARYEHQYEGGWQHTHPGKTLVGRAVTAMYMPRRPAMRKVMEAKGAAHGCIGDQISWPIDMLVPGDVYVADTYGKVDEGPIIGDNLAMAIYANSGNGVVFDGSVRDLEGIEEMPDFPCFVRGLAPLLRLTHDHAPRRQHRGAHRAGHRHARRRGPGQAGRGRVHTAPSRGDRREDVRTRPTQGYVRQAATAEGRYTPGQIDDRWTDVMEADFSEWLEDRMEDLPVPKEAIQEMLKERTW